MVMTTAAKPVTNNSNNNNQSINKNYGIDLLIAHWVSLLFHCHLQFFQQALVSRSSFRDKEMRQREFRSRSYQEWKVGIKPRPSDCRPGPFTAIRLDDLGPVLVDTSENLSQQVQG